jgi:CRP/FNR family transcriptional regulator, polysaccharide utilization system transcription regulator
MATECIIPTYSVLTDDQIQKINSACVPVKHRKGELLFGQDRPVSHLLYVKTGLIKIHRESTNNKTVIVKIVGPDRYLGLLSIFYDLKYQISATVIEESELIYINIQALKDLISQNGQYGLKILEQSSMEGVYLLNKLSVFHQKQVPGRIAELLLSFSTEVYNNNAFTLPLSRQELADYVYSTKESVSRTLTEFKNDRMIDIEDRKVTLKSIDLLKILSKLG